MDLVRRIFKLCSLGQIRINNNFITIIRISDKQFFKWEGDGGHPLIQLPLFMHNIICLL